MSRARTEGITFTKEPYIEDVGPRRIKSMKFSTLSESEIGKIAEVQVWKNSYYDQDKKPIPGGLLDSRMGAANKNLVCATCHGSYQDCPGHYGYLPLVLPVYNVGYLSTTVEILKCICKKCARIFLNEKDHKEWLTKMRNPKLETDMKIDLAKKVIEKCSKMVKYLCPRCGYVNGSVKKAVSAIRIIHDRSKCNDSSIEEYQSALSHTREPRATINSDTLDIKKVLSLFRSMHDEDCEILYLAERPEKLIITNIAVPPIVIRPSVIMDGSQSNENDITERLKLIIQTNNALRQEVKESSGVFKNLDGWEILQAEVARFINSDVRGVPFKIKIKRARHWLVLFSALKGSRDVSVATYLGNVLNILAGQLFHRILI